MNTDEILIMEFVTKFPAQASRALDKLSDAELAGMMNSMTTGLNARVFSLVSSYRLARCLSFIEPERAVTLIDAIDLSTAELLLRQSDENFRQNILDRISDQRSAALRQRLSFVAHSVGALMEPVVFSLSKDHSVGDVKTLISHRGEVVGATICVTDNGGKFEGVVLAEQLLSEADDVVISSIIRTDIPKLYTDMAADSLISHHAWNTYRLLPVIDNNRLLIGALHFERLQREKVGKDISALKHIGQVSDAVGELYSIGLKGILQSIAISK